METLKQQPKQQQRKQQQETTAAETAAAAEREAKFNALFLGKPEKTERPVTERQLFNIDLNNQVRGLGTWFNAVRLPENRDRLLSFLADQKSKGKVFDKTKIETLLNTDSKESKTAGFNLFRKYLNDKEKEKTTFTANQVTGIFLRACLAD